MMKLRALEPSDLPYLYQWENDATAWGDSEVHNPLSQSLLREYIASASGDIFRDGQVRLIAEEEGACVGAIDLFDLDCRSRKAAIGMYIAPEWRGRAVGQEALRLLEEYAFSFLQLHGIYAIIAVDNGPCCSIFRKAKYTESAHLIEWVVRPDGSYSDAIVFQKLKA